jgi:site-specific DNA recombinase
MAAARRKGKWVGGKPVLGYDVAAMGGRLVVNPEEASRVQAVFALYQQHRSLDVVLAEVQARQWTTKHWKTRDGKEHLGRPFTKPTLVRLLRNVLYLGQVSHRSEVYAGEQSAIVEKSVWEMVNQRLAQEQKESGVAAGSATGKEALPVAGSDDTNGESTADHACWLWR